MKSDGVNEPKIANHRPSGETPLIPEDVRPQRSLPVSSSSGARICDPLEPVITTALELEQRDVKPSGRWSGSGSRRGGAPASLAGVNRHRKQSEAFPLFREPNSSRASGVKKKREA